MVRRSGRGRFVRVVSFTAIALAALMALAWSAAARTFTVTLRNDPPPDTCDQGSCSLREAILAARTHQGTDTIEFAKTLSGFTIRLALGELPIRGKLTIAGPGARSSPSAGIT